MRNIIPHEENSALHEKSQEVPLSDIRSERIQELIRDMKELLSKEEHGVALAAVQVGEPLRLFIVSGKALARGDRTSPDQSAHAGQPDSVVPEVSMLDLVYINPELIKMSQRKTKKHEGCLSVRGKWGMVPRAEKAMIRAFDERGTPLTRGASGFLAHIFQHEMDHLDGILYTEKAVELYDDEPETE